MNREKIIQDLINYLEGSEEGSKDKGRMRSFLEGRSDQALLLIEELMNELKGLKKAEIRQDFLADLLYQAIKCMLYCTMPQ